MSWSDKFHWLHAYTYGWTGIGQKVLHKPWPSPIWFWWSSSLRMLKPSAYWCVALPWPDKAAALLRTICHFQRLNPSAQQRLLLAHLKGNQLRAFMNSMQLAFGEMLAVMYRSHVLISATHPTQLSSHYDVGSCGKPNRLDYWPLYLWRERSTPQETRHSQLFITMSISNLVYIAGKF